MNLEFYDIFWLGMSLAAGVVAVVFLFYLPFPYSLLSVALGWAAHYYFKISKER